MAHVVKFAILVTKDVLLLCHKNVANGLTYSSQLWQTLKYLCMFVHRCIIQYKWDGDKFETFRDLFLRHVLTL